MARPVRPVRPVRRAKVAPRAKPVVLSDPRAIRALAHPARLAIVTALYDENVELTATQAAEIAGLTPSAMSYHLRALERAGIVARAEDRQDGRERPWVRAGSELMIDIKDSGTTATLAATNVVIDSAMETDRTDLRGVLARKGTEAERELDRASSLSRHALRITPAEAKRLKKDLEDLLSPYDDRTRTDPPRGADRLNVSILVVTPSVILPESGG
jgi:DNA-binding transcriptional ArsR family regulator